LRRPAPGLPGGTKRFATSEDSTPSGVTSMTLSAAVLPGLNSLSSLVGQRATNSTLPGP
jgi:hypothetical protein